MLRIAKMCCGAGALSDAGFQEDGEELLAVLVSVDRMSGKGHIRTWGPMLGKLRGYTQ